MTDETKAALKDRIFEWLFAQGTSTVLLFAIAMGAWFGIPRYIDSLKGTLVEMERSHREERSDAIKAFVDQREKDRDLIRELIGLRRAGSLPISDPH